MGMFDHWQPMVPSHKLSKRGIAGVKLAGKEIALFRTASGQVAALDEECPHRRMKLSLGQVLGERLMCKYHGWTFGCDGMGESPGTPKMQACASTWDAREAQGYIWVKSKQSNPAFPKFDLDGWCWMCNTEHIAHAPLEVTMDNFCEIEHTPTTHNIFGYQLDAMKDVTVRFETTDDSVKTTNLGMPKRMNFLLRYLIGIKKNHVFRSAWYTYFSPCYLVTDHTWLDPNTGDEAHVKWRVYIFFTPVSATETRVTSFTFAKSRWRVGPNGGLRLFRGLMRRKVAHEINLDVTILDGLARYDTHLQGMKLSRFDKALMFNRERIETIYRGNRATKPERELEFAGQE